MLLCVPIVYSFREREKEGLSTEQTRFPRHQTVSLNSILHSDSLPVDPPTFKGLQMTSCSTQCWSVPVWNPQGIGLRGVCLQCPAFCDPFWCGVEASQHHHQKTNKNTKNQRIFDQTHSHEETFKILWVFSRKKRRRSIWCETKWFSPHVAAGCFLDRFIKLVNLRQLRKVREQALGVVSKTNASVQRGLHSNASKFHGRVAFRGFWKWTLSSFSKKYVFWTKSCTFLVAHKGTDFWPNFLPRGRFLLKWSQF